MKRSSVAVSGDAILGLPSWGKALWQDPNDGGMILLYASGNYEVNYTYTPDSGVTWTAPSLAFPVDDYSIHDNFDSYMDRNGNVHCVHRFNGSGCYSVLGKDFVSGSWAPSGVVSRGFVTAGDTGEAKGVNASITVVDAKVGPFDISTQYPAARLAAKDSSDIVNLWYVPNPFNVFPRIDDMSSVSNNFPAGQAGGFPIFTKNGPFGKEAFWSVDATGIVKADRFFDWKNVEIPVTVPSPAQLGSIEGSGYATSIALNPAMAHIEVFPVLGPPGFETSPSMTYTLLSSKHNDKDPFELLITSNENALTEGKPSTRSSISDVLVRADSLAKMGTAGTISRAPNGLPFVDALKKNLQSHPGASGTLVDMSIGSEKNVLNFYFLNNEPDGQQVISRIKGELITPYVGGSIGGVSFPASPAKIIFGPLSAAVSGIRSWAPAGREYTGGSGLFLNWNNFKAMRHPNGWLNETDPKDEAIITAGSGLDGKYRLVFWKYEDSIDSQFGNLKSATFAAARTGVITATVGITPAEAQTLIDNDTSAGNLMSPADSITFDFGEDFRFDRFEFLWNDTGSNIYDIRLDASLDNVNYTRVLTIPSHFIDIAATLTKASAEFEAGFPDNTVTHDLTPFLGRYIKMSLGTGTGTKDVRQIRFYGASSTLGKYVTQDFSRSFELTGPINLGRVEKFDTVIDGQIPANLTSYGDFNWEVRASGAYADGANGSVNNNTFFQGETNGNGDGFAIRTNPTGVGLGQSGVLEATVTVDKGEVDFNGVAGRTLQFDMRYHLVGSAPTLDENSADDDVVYIQTVTPTGTSTVYYPGRQASDALLACFTNTCNYFTYRTTLPTGTSTIRWVYERGTVVGPGVYEEEGAVWVDNVIGLNIFPQNTIAGFLKGRNFNSSDFTGASGVYGFMEKKMAMEVAAYLKSDESNLNSSKNAYLLSKSAITGSMNAYAYGSMRDSVYGFVQANPESINSSVNAYMFTSGAFSSMLGHMQNRLNDGVNGYLLGPPGVVNSVNAYLITPEFSSINAYLFGPQQIVGQVNAYLDSKGIDDGVNAYLFGSGIPSESIYGYLLNEGDFNSVNGYLLKGEREQVAAYLAGSLAQTGVINAWISGVGITSGGVNASLCAVSGIPSGSIYSYIEGANPQNENINATMIGFGDDSQCNFPLSTLPTIVIPTGNFF
jgi:hypothetical protein